MYVNVVLSLDMCGPPIQLHQPSIDGIQSPPIGPQPPPISEPQFPMDRVQPIPNGL